ncbi:hypothetical protein RDI58_032984 [Solanum bulbocastanum]|uniref:Uncharacterized protein n=1 Tax=Solanum bulbocastanum TaxID=147425 RepID=A0AAN8SJD9_SOLBU
MSCRASGRGAGRASTKLFTYGA